MHVLLSLLLLVSQQLALTHAHVHAYVHTEDVGGGWTQAAGGHEPSKPKLADHICSHCAASAQLAHAIAGQGYSFTALDVSYGPVRADEVNSASQQSVRGFHARAPPQA
ncbi:hypothetical protein ACLB1G_01170 [Oxalobacteraceae bacterium A2-2]